MSEAPRLLHNMSMAPRTTVAWEVRGEGGPHVGFSIDDIPDAPRDARAALDPALVRELDAAWRALAFRGAVLLCPVGDGATVKKPELWCPDRLLVMNVLARARGGLLLAGTPLDPETAAERMQRALMTNDRRLVALARAGATVEASS